MRALLPIALAAVLVVPAALAGPKDPTKRHTAADTKTANAIALKLSDFAAGWKQEKSSSNSAGPGCKAQPDESKLIETADVDPTFDSPNGAVTVDSDVSLYKTKAMLLGDWHTAQVSLFRACLAELLSKSLGKTATVAVAKRVPVTQHAERTLGFHFEFKANGVVISADLIGFAKGRTEAILSAFGPKGSYKRSDLNPLAAVIARRLAGA